MKEPEIIYKDKDIIVVNKPSGLPVHEAQHSTDYSLCDWLLERFPEIKDVGDLPSEALAEEGARQLYRPGIVHRLDKQTSGVMVVARTQESFLRLKEIFKSREIEKIYPALVCGRPKEKTGTIGSPIGRIVTTPTKMGIPSGRGKLRLVKEAATEYKVLKEFENAALWNPPPDPPPRHKPRLLLASPGAGLGAKLVVGGMVHADL